MTAGYCAKFGPVSQLVSAYIKVPKICQRCCFTDGSRNHGLGQSSTGVFDQTTNQEYILPHSK